MDVLVVTGGIGSGKSEVCRVLQEKYACGVYSADERVKGLYASHPTLLDDIAAGLSVDLRDDEGRFVPALLAEVIFRDREALAKVEELVFPALMDDFKAWCDDYRADRFVVFESATVMEKPQFEGFGDKWILVDARFGTRLERAVARDKTDRERVIARMINQPLMNDISEGRAVPDVDAVIINEGSYEDLIRKVTQTIDELYNNR